LRMSARHPMAGQQLVKSTGFSCRDLTTWALKGLGYEVR
jgi:hypothetical protein